jgi:hypothetical protein
MTELLRPLIERKGQQGVQVQFFEAPPGDKKASIMRKVPRRAVLILVNEPDTIVIAMPDLYPLNKEIPHETPDQLNAAIQSEFKRALKQRNLKDDRRYLERFRTFCFKYDLEALILAAQEALALRLGIDAIKVTWQTPVEDQNKDRPPKVVVQELFKQHGTHYSETIDAPLILGLADYAQVAAACPQCFKPFVEFLEQVL